jgi:hypothetical protein
MDRSKLSKSLVHDGDLYEAQRRPDGRWEIIRYPASPFFQPTVVELTRLPTRLYEEFTTYFLQVSRDEKNR